MKLTIEGSFEEIRQFMGATMLMIDSVQPARSAEVHLEDRKEILNRTSATPLEDKLEECPRVTIPEKVQINRDAIEDSSGSVRKAPEIPAVRQDGKNSSVSVRAADELPEHDMDRIKKEDLLIPRFKYDSKLLQKYKKIDFAELDDGKLVIIYLGLHVYTNLEIVSMLPKPLPTGFLTHSGLSPNQNTAFRTYLKYLDSQNSHGSVRVSDSGPVIKEDRKSEDDPDRPFKPMLNGAFSTRTDYDGSKIEGALS